AVQVRGRRRVADRGRRVVARGPRCGAGRARRPAVRAAHVHGDARTARTARSAWRGQGVVSVTEVIWHDLECGPYTADLALWRTLADDAQGPILDVGAGSGRVTLDLARHGHTVTALDVDPDLIAALADRAAAAGLH